MSIVESITITALMMQAQGNGLAEHVAAQPVLQVTTDVSAMSRVLAASDALSSQNNSDTDWHKVRDQALSDVLGAPAWLFQGGQVAEEAPANAQSAQNNPLENEMNPRLDRAVTRGLARLASMQRADGSFGEPQFGRSVAVTALACLAFMADGNLPGRGAYGDQVTKGLEFVLKSSTESGLLATDSANSPMYGHGFATLFLGEVYGMTQGGSDTELADRTHKTLVRAVRLIESTQNSDGGWRYNPVPFDADTSVTICQIMALRSGRNAGLEVSKTVVDKAVEYVRSCQNAADGGFRYQLVPGPSAWPRSAAGVASLQYAGIYEDRAIDSGMKYLMDTALPGKNNPNNQIHYSYGMYYGVQAAFLAGGTNWATWWPAARDELIGNQAQDASWSDSGIGEEYGTAMALIVLQMPKRYLPIFQK